MEQLLLHLVGDYITQTDKMATHKTVSWDWAISHAAVYSIPFILLTQSPLALAVIFGTHAVIDRFRLARYVVWLKNKATSGSNPNMLWENCKATGYPSETPVWLAVWLLIIADNTIHLVLNWAAIRWL